MDFLPVPLESLDRISMLLVKRIDVLYFHIISDKILGEYTYTLGFGHSCPVEKFLNTNLLIDADRSSAECDSLAERLDASCDGAIPRDPHILSVHAVESERGKVVRCPTRAGRPGGCNNKKRYVRHTYYKIVTVQL